MIKKNITVILFSLISIISNAQTFTGTYVHQVNPINIKNFYKVTASQGKTWSAHSKSLTQQNYSKLQKSKSKNGATIIHLDDNNKILTQSDKPEYYKNDNHNVLLSRSFISYKSCYIKESLDQMKWDISDKTIVHNNRTCNIATTHFRGKEWTVYFDTSIPFNVAPWKFYGLPGAVVFAETSDKVYSFELKDYEIKEENTEIENPFQKEKLLTWDSYTKNYKQHLKKMLKYTSSPEDEGGGKITINNTIEDLGFTEVKE